MKSDVIVEPLTLDGRRYVVIGCAAAAWTRLHELAPAELDVVLSWVEGESTRSIATRRGVSVRTVERQRASAYRKLGVGSRQELIALLGARARG